MRRILVTGATGATGGAVLQALAGRDVTVRAMQRKAGETALASADETAVADFDDRAALTAALADVDAAYLVTPSSEQAAQRQIRFLDAARAAGVGQVAILSQLAATADSPVRFLRWHAEVERYAAEHGPAHTILRPNLFLQGTLAFAGLIRATGGFGAPIGDATVSAVDVRDIGDAAAAVLTSDGHQGRTYDLTGPAAITHARLAEAISAATGRPVHFADVSPDEFAAQLRGALPDWQVDGLLEDYAHYRRGEAAAVSSAVPDLTGHPARSVDEFASAYADAFRA
ncbi:NmrA family NAD(P)-binding protein [Actinocatenispora sera]|uniref:NAD(P)-dependent oxidoreductase n=1 Tax=Actinocatenispora sera TaxID=390989 RepID=A0A810L422_9ACTN|nr:NmrA family NAD(P)-binding protein [Actinocatenispora sera]BCJ29967.1 NAD(P)-dependent oxidoreductase [Actinocatenispora sera]